MSNCALLLVSLFAVQAAAVRHINGDNVKIPVERPFPVVIEELGEECTGTGNAFPYHNRLWRGAGTCKERNITYGIPQPGRTLTVDLRCYVGTKHAKKGEKGTCHIARSKECVQYVPGQESSGGCRQPTVCRMLRTIIRNKRNGAWYKPVSRSYCVDKESKKTEHFVN